MKIVAIKDMSAGERVWQETAVFNSKQAIDDVLEWAAPDMGSERLRKRVVLTIPELGWYEEEGPK